MGRALLRHLSAVAWPVLVFFLLHHTASAQQTSTQISRGVASLQTQLRNDGSLTAQSTFISPAFQARSKAALTLHALATVPATLLDGLSTLIGRHDLLLPPR